MDQEAARPVIHEAVQIAHYEVGMQVPSLSVASEPEMVILKIQHHFDDHGNHRLVASMDQKGVRHSILGEWTIYTSIAKLDVGFGKILLATTDYFTEQVYVAELPIFLRRSS